MPGFLCAGRKTKTSGMIAAKTMTKITDKNSNAIRAGAQLQSEQLPTDTNQQRIIGNCQELRQAIAEGRSEFLLLLCGGAYSRKTITTASKGRFRILNHIDGSRQVLTEKELHTESNVGLAMSNGALIAEGESYE